MCIGAHLFIGLITSISLYVSVPTYALAGSHRLAYMYLCPPMIGIYRSVAVAVAFARTVHKLFASCIILEWVLLIVCLLICLPPIYLLEKGDVILPCSAFSCNNISPIILCRVLFFKYLKKTGQHRVEISAIIDSTVQIFHDIVPLKNLL